ncbi:MAG: transporter substrate-binding domain-containing protein [Acetobacteraceae bacterium]|nr:transporter substrate-binding domain-containing protein [Acetobacteraceae bacterium]
MTRPGIAALLLLLLTPAAEARSLAALQARGTLELCAHPNALPFSSRADNPPGFQIELGRALAKELGLSLTPVWIVTTSQIRAAGCDIILDAIADQQAQEETGLKLGRPYYRSGVVLAVRPESPVRAYRDLGAHNRVGVQVGSVAAMTLDGRGVPISVFGFEDDILQGLAGGDIDAAAVTPVAAGFYNAGHPGDALRLVHPDGSVPALSWNVSVGMKAPDEALRRAVDDAMARLAERGVLQGIYGRYGVTLQPPE